MPANAFAGKACASPTREPRFSGFNSDKIAAAAFNGLTYRRALLSSAMRVRLLRCFIGKPFELLAILDTTRALTIPFHHRAGVPRRGRMKNQWLGSV
jgi:hypothetical protein